MAKRRTNMLVRKLKGSLCEAIQSTENRAQYYEHFLRWLDEHEKDFLSLGAIYELDMFVHIDSRSLPLSYLGEFDLNGEIKRIKVLGERMKTKEFSMLIFSKLWDGTILKSNRVCDVCGEAREFGYVEGRSSKEILLQCERCGSVFDMNGNKVAKIRIRPASIEALTQAGILNGKGPIKS